MLSIVNAVQSPLHICPNAKGNPVIFDVTVSPDPLIPGQVAIYHIYGTLREELIVTILPFYFQLELGARIKNLQLVQEILNIQLKLEQQLN